MAKRATKRTERKTAPRTQRATIPDHELAHIHESLRGSVALVSELVPDPRNANQHDQRSIDEIAKSIQRFGFTTPILAQQDTKQIIAGNGRHAAAIALGFKYVPVGWTKFDDKTAIAYAIADNRTAQFATWNQEQLATLLAELEEEGTYSAVDIGFAPDELQAIIDAATTEPHRQEHEEEAAPDQSAQLKQKFEVIIICDDEQHQRDTLDHLRRNGYTAKALVGG